MSKRNTTDTSPDYDDFDRSRVVEGELGLFVRHRMLVFIGLSGLDWRDLAIFDTVG